MSGLGLLATALAGGAGVIGKQAGDDIEQGRRADMMRQQADIEEQMRMRIMERQEALGRDRTLWETSGEGGAAKLGFAQRAGEQANDLNLKGKVAEASNPELAAARDTQAEAELQRDIKRINATAGPEADKAVKIAEARARIEAKYRKADPTLQSKMAEYEAATGVKLTPEERKEFARTAYGLNKGRDPETGYKTVVTKQFDSQGNEIGSTTRKVPIRGGDGAEAEPADPYKIDPGTAAKVAGKPAPAAKPAAAAKDEGPGMLESLRKTVSGALEGGSKVGNAIEAVRAKVRAGQPLTAEESAIAKKYSLLQG